MIKDTNVGFALVFAALVAALFLAFVKDRIVYRSDKIEAARKWVPLLIAIMAGSFAAYLAMRLIVLVVTGR